MNAGDRTLFARAKLFGVGTQMVEGLRSFVQRLAASHQMKPIAVLLDLVVAGLMETSTMAIEEINKHWAVHGISSLGADLVSALEKACDTELHGSTCSSLSGLVGIQHLTRSGPARYCPVCSSQPQRYGPLLFEVACVEACPIHGVLLRGSNDCGAPEGMRLLAQNRPSEPGICGSCGSIGHGCRLGVESASPQQIWVAREVGALLAKMSASPSIWTSASLVQGLVELVNARFESSVVRAALESGLSRGSVCTWIRGRGRPTLSMLVQLCQRADADVVALFDGRYLRSTSSIPNAASQ